MREDSDSNDVQLELTEQDKVFYNQDGSLKSFIYRLNTAHMTIMLTTSQFMTFLLHFQMRYLEGNLYENSEYQGASDLIAVIFGVIIYNFLGGLKATYFLAFSISTVGTLGILYIENNFEDHPELLATN